MDAKLLEILACPLCELRPPLALREIGDSGGASPNSYLRNSYLICTQCGHGFPVVDDIPHLLPESAIDPEELKGLLNAR